VAECCELGDGFEVGRTEFYSQYQMFCKDSGLSPFSQTRFNKEIEIGYPGVARAKDKTGRRKTWRGIRYVDDAD
jgi:putative DNA primase/helicase